MTVRLSEKSLQRTFLIGDTFFEHCVNILGEIRTPYDWLENKKKHAYIYLMHFFTLT